MKTKSLDEIRNELDVVAGLLRINKQTRAAEVLLDAYTDWNTKLSAAQSVQQACINMGEEIPFWVQGIITAQPKMETRFQTLCEQGWGVEFLATQKKKAEDNWELEDGLGLGLVIGEQMVEDYCLEGW